MINNLGRYLFNLIIIILIQVIILNNLNLGGYINPFLYVLFILTLPVDIPDWLLLVIGFFLGLLMDIFLNSLGMHTSASVFIAFLRPFLLRYLAPRDGYEPGSLPIPSYFGFSWFLKYSAISVFAHHLFLFLIEAFTFANFFTTLWKTTVSTLFTLLIITIAMLFGHQKEKRF